MTRPFWRSPLMILLAATAVVVISNGTRHTFGLFLKPMTETLDWGRETFAFAIALQNILWGVTQPLTGMIADRFGPGRMILAGSVTYGVGLYLMSITATPAMLAFSAGMLVAVGVSATSFAVVFGAVSRAAPEHRRSLYMGVAAAGASFGQFMMLPVGQGLIAGLGWSDALVVLAVLVLLMPLLALSLTGHRHTEPAAGEAANPWHALREASGQGRYWLLFWGFFVCGFHVAFIGTHLPAYLVDQSISPGVAAMALSVIGLFNIGGALWWSYLGGRYSKRKTLCVIYLLRAGIITLLVTLPPSPFSVLTFAAGMGFLWLGTVPVTSALVAQMYGVRYLSTLFGVVFFGHQIGAFLAVWLGGRIFDVTGSYQQVWIAAIALGVFSAMLHWPIDERNREDRALGLAQEPA